MCAHEVRVEEIERGTRRPEVPDKTFLDAARDEGEEGFTLYAPAAFSLRSRVKFVGGPLPMFEDVATVRGRSPRWLVSVLYASSAAALGVAFALVKMHPRGPAGLAGALAMMALVLGPAGAMVVAGARGWRARVRVDEGGHHVDGRLFFTRSELAEPAVSAPNRVCVRTVSGLRLNVDFEDVRRARAFAAALDAQRARGAPDRIERFRVTTDAHGPRSVVVVTLVTVAVLVAFATRSPHFGLAVAVLGIGVLLALAAGLRLELGSDGIALRGLLGARFLSYSRVLRVASNGRAVVLVLTDGRKLTFSPVVMTAPQTGGAASALADRLVAAKQAFELARTDDVARALPLLARGARSTQVWLRDLERLGHDAPTDYREAAPPAPETLWRIVEDAAADESARASAAVLLRRASLDDPGRERLRVAVRQSASPALRRSLEAALDDDDDVVTAALGEL